MQVRDNKLLKIKDKGKIIFNSGSLKSKFGIVSSSLLVVFLFYFGFYWTFNGLSKIMQNGKMLSGLFDLIIGFTCLIAGISFLLMDISFLCSYIIIYENGILHRNPNYYTFFIKRFIPFIQITKIEEITERRTSHARAKGRTYYIKVLHVSTTIGKTFKISRAHVSEHSFAYIRDYLLIKFSTDRE
ncbi:MAG: hypothetical protein ACFFAN_05555 [Promethearchaeota archaeon]